MLILVLFYFWAVVLNRHGAKPWGWLQWSWRRATEDLRDNYQRLRPWAFKLRYRTEQI
jgi:hypothetical protein